jgi:hypothetical protein
VIEAAFEFTAGEAEAEPGGAPDRGGEK